MNDARKAAILAAVGRWLDTHGDEPLPQGIDPVLAEGEATVVPDLLALANAVTACRLDVQVQSKAFKRLEEKLAATAVAPPPVAQPSRDDATLSALRGDLIDVFDRLRRCVQASAEAPRAGGFFAGKRPLQAHAAAVRQGIEMTLSRLEEVLARVDVRAFDPRGQAFDAARMSALGTAPASAEHKDGTVAETIRVGFTRQGAVHRPAEVRVARTKGIA